MSAHIVLPEPIHFSGNWADWSSFVELYYRIFRRDLLDSPKPMFQDRTVLVSRYIGDNDEGKESKFWHLITREHKDGGRDPDPDRASRIEWIRILIEKQAHFKCWKYLEVAERKEFRWYIWAEDDNFLVILAERDELFHLVTSFWVNDWNKKKLDKKYAKRVQ